MYYPGTPNSKAFSLSASATTSIDAILLPYFTDAERAALALTEAATLIGHRPEAVSDEIWDEARRQIAGSVKQ